MGAPKKFVKPHNVIKVLIFQFWHTPIVFFCKIAIFKNSDLCSNHVYKMNGVSIWFCRWTVWVRFGDHDTTNYFRITFVLRVGCSAEVSGRTTNYF